MPEQKLLCITPSLGVFLVLCYVALSRARGEGSAEVSSSSSSRQKLRKRLSGEGRVEQQQQQQPQCEGLVDLIRDESLLLQQRETKPSLTREQLSAARMVVVIIGPASTAVHQSYVVEKLLRYLRWSNLIRRHFRMASEDRDPSGSEGSDATAVRANLAKPEESSSSDIAEEGCSPQRGGDALDSCAVPGEQNGPHPNGDGRDSDGGAGGRRAANKDSKHATPDAARHTLGDTFSDRGKAAALAKIAAQEAAKSVASWLNGLNAGGVAVVEAGGAGWASTRRGRDALPGFLRQTTEPDVGVLWVEILPSGLHHACSNGKAEPQRPPTQAHSLPLFTPTRISSRSPAVTAAGAAAANATAAAWAACPATNGGGAAWKSAHGFGHGVPKGPGWNVVDTFIQSGNLIGAGGHVIYESVRRGQRGTAGGKGKSCFVSMADQGSDVQSQLQHAACPLVHRIGTFAGALRMKNSWHGGPVYLTRHGESLGNTTKSMGGDGKLSETGDRYAGVLADFVAAQPDARQSRLLVWCSPMKRAVQTARAVKCHQYTQWQALTELDTGVFNGFSYKQVERDYPEEFAAREADKLCYRYPEGEGYLDVVNRLDPVVVALEMEDRPVIVISHQAVLRCLYAYFHDISLREMPRIPISLHTVVKLTPIDYHPEAAAAAASAGAGPRLWKELRFELIKQTPLQQLAGVAAVNGGMNRRASQLGESLS